VGGQDIAAQLSVESVQQDLQQHPLIFMRLAENGLTVAESLRGNYFHNTAQFIRALRMAVRRGEPLMHIRDVGDLFWDNVQGEVVTFIDGGVGEVKISSQVPVLLRVGSYCVRTGERNLAEREQFGYYPVILGDLEGGSKERGNFVDIVRITSELLGGLAVLDRTPDLRVLMFHGPLVYPVGAYAGHTPFTEPDIDLFLRQYAPDPAAGTALKEEFLREAAIDIYPAIAPGRAHEWVERRVFEPLAWLAFLYRRLIRKASERTPCPIIAGVVERGTLRDFSENVLLERVFRGLRARGNDSYFNEMFGRTDLSTPKNLLDRLGYTDGLLLAMLLRPGEMAEPWEMTKYEGLHSAGVSLPGEAFETVAGFEKLKAGPFGFPRVLGTYVQATRTTEPVRVEVFADLGEDQMLEAARRAYLYSRLLPGYGFPVGLDIADRYAKVPAWMTDAYGKLIRLQLGISLQQGEVSDAAMRDILVQAIYMTHRDWLFRPEA
jgi:hypothetical protein